VRATDTKSVEFDLFISHASEDKDGFVRDLASALEARRLRAWYDEFTLRPGDSLRRSIDHGLLTSQAGVVVLSPAFFGKRWTAYELDGLVQLYAGDPDQVAGSGRGSRIIPVWYDVDACAVAQYSPSLANLVALQSRNGVEAVADQILKVLRPAGSALLFARAELIEMGARLEWTPPIVTDDWWLDVAEANARNNDEGYFLEATGWGHWGFPLPPRSDEPRERGHRLARAAAQMMWQRAARQLKVCQTTQPEDVLDFIKSQPGMDEVCVEHPRFLLSYAPQLALPGVAGWLQDVVDLAYERALDLVRKQGQDPNSPEGRRWVTDYAPHVSLRDLELVRTNPHWVTWHWALGGFGGPAVRMHDAIDYAGWLASDASSWMGNELRALLFENMRGWALGTNYNTSERLSVDIERLGWNEAHQIDTTLLPRIRSAMCVRLEKTKRLLNINEDPEVLADRIMALHL
jgi:hypothetical protein